MLGKLNDKCHIIFFTNTVFNAALFRTISVLQFLLLSQMNLKNFSFVLLLHPLHPGTQQY